MRPAQPQGGSESTPLDPSRDRILVVGPSWVGDMVMAQSLFQQLKILRPDAQIDVLAPAWTFPLLDRMPEVHKGYAMPVGHGRLELAQRYRLGRQLRAQAYDQAILLPNSFKSALVPLFARIPQRTGWRGEWRYGLLNDLRVLDTQRLALMIERFVALAFSKAEAYQRCAALKGQFPRPALSIDEQQRAAALAAFGLDSARPLLALCPGAEFGAAKRWPEQHYAALAARQIDRGWQVWLFGSANDQAVSGAIRTALSPEQQHYCVDLAGRTSLAQAIDLLSLATVVASNDSGLMHVAAALARPLIAIYGSTSPAFTPPLAEQVEILSIAVDCGPCFQRQCPQQHLKCLRELSPSLAFAALDRLTADKIEVLA